MGVYNTFQFFGVFFGGFVGGVIYGNFGLVAVFIACALMLLIWVYLVYTAPTLRLLDSLVVNVHHSSEVDCKTMLEAVEGVEEVIIIEGESTAYLKVDKEQLDHNALEEIDVVGISS